MARFEVGKTYRWADSGFDPIKVLRRTEKTIWVTNGGASWRMRIKHDEHGDEFVVDSSVPKRWQGAFTCSPELEIK